MDDRDRLRQKLTDLLATRPLGEFALGQVQEASFGVVDRARADYLGLSLTVDLYFPSGGTCVAVDEETSLAILRVVGTASELEGRLLWLHLGPDGNYSYVRFTPEVRRDSDA